jgi:hypothetical protein
MELEVRVGDCGKKIREGVGGLYKEGGKKNY